MVAGRSYTISCEPSHHATYLSDTADASRHRTTNNGASLIGTYYSADIIVRFYINLIQFYILHHTILTKIANKSYIVGFRLVKGQPRDGLAVAVKGAGVLFFIISYRRPLFACEVEVCVKGNVNVGLTSVH